MATAKKAAAAPAARTAPEPAPEAPATNIIEAIRRVKRDVGAVGKSERNQSQNYNFRGIDAVRNALSPWLHAHGVVQSPEILSFEYGEVEVGRNRTKQAHVKITVRFRFYGPGGVEDYIEAIVPGESMDSGDKATAKAMSVAERIALLSVFSLPTDEKDPDHDTYERSAPATAAEVEAAVNEALRARDPRAAVIEVGNTFGREALDVLMVTGPSGESITGTELIEGWIGQIDRKANEAAEAREAAAAQDQAGEPETAAQEPAEAPQEPVSAPVDTSAAEAAKEKANRPAPPTKNQSQSDKQRNAWLVEVKMQADALGVEPLDHMAALLEGRDGGPSSVPLPTLRAWVQAQRPAVVGHLRNSGNATVAEAYEGHAKSSANQPAHPDAILGAAPVA